MFLLLVIFSLRLVSAPFLLCLSFHNSLPIDSGLFSRQFAGVHVRAGCSFSGDAIPPEHRLKMFWMLHATFGLIVSVPARYPQKNTTVVIRIANCALLHVVKDTLSKCYPCFFISHNGRNPCFGNAQAIVLLLECKILLPCLSVGLLMASLPDHELWARLHNSDLK